MKKNIFLIALVLMMLLITACQSNETPAPSPTVPAATIPADNGSDNPITTVMPEATAPAATATPSVTAQPESTAEAE